MPLTDTRRRSMRHPAERAVKWLIENPHATYREACNLFPGAGLHSIRARVNNRWGSLAAARAQRREHLMAATGKTWARPCIGCGVTDRRPRGQYRCDACKAKDHDVHDGGV